MNEVPMVRCGDAANASFYGEVQSVPEKSRFANNFIPVLARRVAAGPHRRRQRLDGLLGVPAWPTATVRWIR